MVQKEKHRYIRLEWKSHLFRFPFAHIADAFSKRRLGVPYAGAVGKEWKEGDEKISSCKNVDALNLLEFFPKLLANSARLLEESSGGGDEG